MRVLFICRQKTKTNVSPFVKSQAQALTKEGINVDFFLIKNNGVLGYLKSIRELIHYTERREYDIYHAHYSFSGYVASLAKKKPLVVSLLGTDVIKSYFSRLILKLMSSICNWRHIIVKSSEMKNLLKIKKIQVVPNGVSFDTFYPIDQKKARSVLNWNLEEKIVLFNGNKSNPIKNYVLAEKALSLCKINIKIVEMKNLDQEKLNLYYNACDVFLSTSLWEGSPNTIKEAMACNANIISTNVGDVNYLFGKEKYNRICSFDPLEISTAITDNLGVKKENNKGRERLIHLSLQGTDVAQKIIKLYHTILA
ncbi:MAG: glycosyl transferase group 1 [Cryomorphaceae bacterium]|nr:glycosyl transferase group 1 [Cryomorphaceae bacterium]